MWRENFLQKSMVKSPKTFPFMVLGNKLDVAAADESSRAVSEAEVSEYCELSGIGACLETSAKENTNVETAFHQLVQLALKRQASMQDEHEDLQTATKQ